MALNSDIAYKFGCGRYIQGKDAIADNLALELKRFGTKALFICGENGYKAAHDLIEKALANAETEYEYKIFTSTPCFENADEYAAYAKENGFDIICGVGGGVLMDTVKFVAERANLPLVQIPTISATCAAATPLSVLYDRNTHAHIGSVKLMREADAVIVDLGIMIGQPKRLYWAGIMDSMAKLIEINHRVYGKSESEIPMGLEIAHIISKQIYDWYEEKYAALGEALDKKEITPEFEKSVFYAIAVTGVISGISKGSNQCAIAHKFYEKSRSHYYNETVDFVHGELVAMGLIIQLAYNGFDYAPMVKKLCEMGLPTCFSDVNIPLDGRSLEIYTDELCASSAVMDTSEESKSKVRDALMSVYR